MTELRTLFGIVKYQKIKTEVVEKQKFQFLETKHSNIHQYMNNVMWWPYYNYYVISY